MKTVATFADTRAACAGTVGLVPTMGFLHEGHLSLIQRAAAESDTVIVSLFVNPLQFDDPDDLARYPSDLERDQVLAEGAGADVLFTPTREVMLFGAEAPDGGGEQLTTVHVSELTDGLEGAHRPGHFDGVATIVTKLVAGIQPDVAYFGRKDAQQLAIVRRLAVDLSLPVRIVGCPTVREGDGLALSSRNVLIENREAALTLSSGLMEAADAVDRGERDGMMLCGMAIEAMMRHPGVTPEYAALASQRNVRLLDRLDEPAFLAVAARVGGVRLIDNIHIDAPAERTGSAPSAGADFVADRGILLDRPSVLYTGGH